MIRWALLTAFAAAPAAAQTPEFDADAPYYVQQHTPDGWLIESGGRQFLCQSLAPAGTVLVPEVCMAFGTLGEARGSGAAQIAQTEQLVTVLRMVENMPDPAFHAALIDLVVQSGCVLDFADYDVMERALVTGMRQQLSLPDDVADAVDPILKDRIGDAFDAMTDQFEVDEAARTATLTIGCD